MCSSGNCLFGSGASGPLNVTSATSINAIRAVATATAGSMTVTISGATGSFAAGQAVLIHQTQAIAAPVGQYEYARVVSATATSVVLTAGLRYSYVSDASHRAQIIVVPEYTTVSVSAGQTLTAAAWNGSTGGILAFNATGAVTVTGTISMDGRGFRGTRHGACGLHCTAGQAGESQRAIGAVTMGSNGSGGGGGSPGQDCSAGGGGGHAGAGADGTDGSCGLCTVACPSAGGNGGNAVGSAILSSTILFGGAGGEGGHDEDGGNAGTGGTGGGIVIIRANSVSVTGAITSAGTAGGRGDNVGCGVGAGMGGAGGGAGGAVRIQTLGTAAVGSGLVRAGGGGGGLCSSGGSPGGAGSVGRIGIRASTVTGTTTPTFNPN